MAFIDVVQWNATPDVFAWRFPERNLTTLTQLIVNESQEAVLFHGGKLLQKFGPGKHTLSTENIPLLENLYGIPFGGENPFQAEVWFVNRVSVLDIKWGTRQPFLVRDPEFGVMIPVRGYGQFGIRIEEAERFLVTLVGTLPEFDKNRLTEYFRGLLMSRATSAIARKIKDQKVSVLDIAAYVSELSDDLQRTMGEAFEKYGIRLVNFYLSQVTVPEDDPAVAELRKTLSRRADMDVLKYDYGQQRSFDVVDKAAANTGTAGALMGAGMGLGMGFGAGGAVGGMMSDVARQVRPPVVPTHPCPSCGAGVPQGARFCPACGQAEPAASVTAQKKCAVCDRCGRPIPVGAQFCPSCGDRYNPCPACGADVPEGVAACPSCGGKMPFKCDCGASVAPDARFCPSCGRALIKVCPSCGREVAEGESFCAGCGAKIR